jgi:hypothetical protein
LRICEAAQLLANILGIFVTPKSCCTLLACCGLLRRLLKEGGVMLNITYGEPSARVPLLQRLKFDVEFYMLNKSQELAAGAAVAGAPVGTSGGITVQGPMDVHTQVGPAGTTAGTTTASSGLQDWRSTNAAKAEAAAFKAFSLSN